MKEFDEEDLYFKNAIAKKLLQEFIGIRAEWYQGGNRIYVDAAVKHLTRRDAWIGA